MAEGEEACIGGEVKHLLLGKFKDGVPQEVIDQLIKEYANLLNLIQPMKSFSWGRDVSTVKLNELGFTHILELESTFESTELKVLQSTLLMLNTQTRSFLSRRNLWWLTTNPQLSTSNV